MRSPSSGNQKNGPIVLSAQSRENEAQGLFLRVTTKSSDGSDGRELPRPKAPPKAILPDSYSSPAWSPDGKRIAFVRKVWLPNKKFLFPTTIETVDAEGGDRQVVTKVFDSTGTTLSWSPDGESFAFTDLRENVPGLWMIPSTG